MLQAEGKETVRKKLLGLPRSWRRCRHARRSDLEVACHRVRMSQEAQDAHFRSQEAQDAHLRSRAAEDQLLGAQGSKRV